MSEAKRYACITASGIGSVKVCESPNGKFIMYEDYVELQEKLHTAEVKLAELAELEKQEPAEYQYYYHNHGTGAGQWLPVTRKQAFESMKAKHAGDNDFSFRELFTRPAPAVSLAELVPNEIESGSGSDFDDYYCDGFNACRDATLRNIEKL